ncbi:hypothetical protein GCM10017771_29710 [Streptomyces capitiformicae]|uniref:Uncharacterized protein n=1 Tax=Streptomyces capitiformicae TaxID=2014920 RepID=A0A919L8C7_9ACTN|nr:hypothetical protein GCM10017771_29710 [Streptomyces capitiformicae]
MAGCPAASRGSRRSRNIRYAPELPFLGADISTASVGSPSPTPNWKSRYLNEFMDLREGP